MWEDLTMALCGVGFALGVTLLTIGVLGTLAPDRQWLPPGFRART